MGDVDLVFGWRTALLLMLSVQVLVLACALAAQPMNRAANRILAAFLLVVTGVMTPYTIGFAGFYDAWMWLTFAPLALPLFLAPLLYGYAHALVRGQPPAKWPWHLAPGLAQLAYMIVAFALPFESKMAWADQGDGPFVSRLIALGVTAGLIAYSLAGLRLLRAYRRGLAQQRSDDDLFAMRWLDRVLAAMGAATVAWAAWQGWGLATGRFDYFEFFWLHLLFGFIGLALGVEGWRHAALRFEPLSADPPAPAVERDWSEVGADVERRTREGGWWQEPELTLATLARRLGTNTGRVSRAVNLGLGVNFSTFVNGLRAEAVARALHDRPDANLLDLAFEMGFASKASFNRAFRSRFGMAPSQYRLRVSDREFHPAGQELRRTRSPSKPG